MAKIFQTVQNLVNAGFLQTSGQTLSLSGHTLVGDSATFRYATNQHSRYTARSIVDASYVTGLTANISHIGSNEQVIFRDISGITGATNFTYNKALSGVTVPNLIISITPITDTGVTWVLTWDNTTGQVKKAQYSSGGTTGGTSYTFSNGLTKTGNVVRWGGDLTTGTSINTCGNCMYITGLPAKTSETCGVYIDSIGKLSIGVISGGTGGGIVWSGNSVNGIGTYIDSGHICSQSGLTFNGTTLGINGDVCASSCVCSPIICGTSCIVSPEFVENGTCLANKYLATGGTAVCADNSACLGSQLPSYYASSANVITGATNGLTKTGNTVCLGGDLISDVVIGTCTGANSVNRLAILGCHVCMCFDNSATDAFTINTNTPGGVCNTIGMSNGCSYINTTNLGLCFGTYGCVQGIATVTDASTCPHGLQYAGDYSPYYTCLSIPNAGWVTGITTGITANIMYISGITSGNTVAILTNYNLFTGYTAATNATLTGITVNIIYISGITSGNTTAIITNYNIFTGYTATTQPIIDAAITGATNGLSVSGRNIGLGGKLTGNTLIDLNGHIFSICGDPSNDFLVLNDCNTSACFGSNKTSSSTILRSCCFQLYLSTFAKFTDFSPIPSGLTYNACYHNTYGKRSLVDKEYVDNCVYCYISGATNLGSGNGTIYTSVSSNKIRLKTLSGGTNVTLTCDGNYIAINAKNNLYSYSAITTGVTLSTGSSYLILANSTGGAFAIKLPATPVNGEAFKIKNTACGLTNNITICGNGNNIDGSVCALINTNCGALEVMYDGSAWFSLSFVN
jgi:hypothetical protein